MMKFSSFASWPSIAAEVISILYLLLIVYLFLYSVYIKNNYFNLKSYIWDRSLPFFPLPKPYFQNRITKIILPKPYYQSTSSLEYTSKHFKNIHMKLFYSWFFLFLFFPIFTFLNSFSLTFLNLFNTVSELLIGENLGMGSIKNILAKDQEGSWMSLYTTTVDDSIQVCVILFHFLFWHFCFVLLQAN